MRITKLFYYLIILALLSQTSVVKGASEDVEMPEENQLCLKCHGNKYYSFYNEYTEQEERKLMNPYFVIDSVTYLKGEHQLLYCTDCHASEYETYPHMAELKVEPTMTCVDCHDFGTIEKEVRKSVHAEAFGEQMNCEICHDPHTNKLVKSDMAELIRYNNNRCLNCHNDIEKYQIYTSEENPKILKTHEWLPNQALHFDKVRCIECHTSVTDTSDAVHRIVPREEAVKNCNECHSSSSALRDKLYKHELKQDRAEYNFYRSYILNDAYVIGANRNYFVNLITLIVFGLTLTGIIIHTIFRIIKRK